MIHKRVHNVLPSATAGRLWLIAKDLPNSKLTATEASYAHLRIRACCYNSGHVCTMAHYIPFRRRIGEMRVAVDVAIDPTLE